MKSYTRVESRFSTDAMDLTECPDSVDGDLTQLIVDTHRHKVVLLVLPFPFQ